MEYKERIKDFRVEVDKCQKIAEEFMAAGQPARDCDRRMQIVHNKLVEAKMWLGKCLEAAGSELPKEFQDKAE